MPFCRSTPGKLTVKGKLSFADTRDLELQTASEDFSDLPNALGVPYTYWGIGGADADRYARARVNHSPLFAPVLQPTLDTGTQALVVAALAWLGRD